MTAEQVTTGAFLLMSVESLAVYTWALRRLRRDKAPHNLVRTAVCRIAVAVIYVGIGINATTWQFSVLAVTFAATVLTQATWQYNSHLDVLHNQPRPPRKRRIQIIITRDPPRPM